MNITNLQKKLIIVLSILTVIMISISVGLYRAFNMNPNKLNVVYKTLQNDKIPQELDDVSIVYFTDLQYGKYQNEERTKKLFDTINELAPDIVIFGGDLYDTDTEITDETNALLANYLSSLDAPLGKFAVAGEKDQQDEARMNALNWIYATSQFEVLGDWNVKIGDQNGNTVRLIGISPQANFDQALSNLSSEEYNLLFTHYPDTLINERLASSSISFAIAGHSHGTQITYPFIGGYKTIDNASELNRFNTRDLSFDYIISTGVGCTNINARFLSTPEIYYFILKH